MINRPILVISHGSFSHQEYSCSLVRRLQIGNIITHVNQYHAAFLQEVQDIKVHILVFFLYFNVRFNSPLAEGVPVCMRCTLSYSLYY